MRLLVEPDMRPSFKASRGLLRRLAIFPFGVYLLTGLLMMLASLPGMLMFLLTAAGGAVHAGGGVLQNKWFPPPGRCWENDNFIDNFNFIGYNTRVYSKEEDEYPSWRCKESFRLGERERAADGEYTLELAPKRLFWKAQ